MKQNLLQSLRLRFALLVALLCSLGTGTAWATDYSETYNYSALSGMLSGNYDDASSYWKVPGTAGKTATIAIPITYQPTSNITITFNIATFGSGTNPSSSNTTITAVGTETGSNWSGSDVSQYPSDKNYKNCVMTITKPGSPTTLGGLTITMGVNSGVKIFRLQSITVEYTYTASSDPSSDVSFASTAPSLDLKDDDKYTQVATTADGYAETDGASVTYEMTANTAGATIDASSGTVTPTKAGSVTVKATAAAIAGEFASSYATYTLTVTDTREWDVTCHIGNNTSVVKRVTGTTLSLDNPSAICGMSFVGWSSTDNVASPTWVSNSTKVSGNMALYAMYEYVPGEYSYHLVESSQADWRGDYLIAYSSTIFADGRKGGKDDTGSIGKQDVSVNPGDNLEGKVVDVTWGDTYNVTIEAIDDADLSKGYLLKTKDGKYNYQTSNSNGLSATATRATAATYPLSITYNSSSDIDIAISAGAQFHYNEDGYFRFYKDGGMKNVCLYKKTADVAPVYSLGLTESVTVTDAGYATYASTNALDFTEAGIYAYIAKADGRTGVTYERIMKVPANTGVLLVYDGGTTEGILKFDGTGADATTGNVFVKGTGATVASVVESTKHNYILNIVNNVLGFYRAAGNTVAANRAYIQIDWSEVGEVKEFISIDFDSIVDGIGDVRSKMDDVRGEIFNLAGQKMSRLQKGINIVNGKKVFVK